MNDLVALVSEKTGLSEEMSQMAVETVLSYLKEQLPEPLAGQVDSLISGEGGLEGGLGMLKGLGGLLK